MRIPLSLVVLLAWTPPLAAQPKAPVNSNIVKSDLALLRDENKAIAEFQRRLHDQVVYRNGLLVIIDRAGITPGVTVMPITVTWAVDCGDSGISVVFGSGSGDTDNGIALRLTNASVTGDKCTRIAPAVGETLLAITKGN